MTPLVLVVTALAQAARPSAGPPAPAAPLFASPDPLTFSIEAPLSTIFKDRAEERDERPANLILTGNDGQLVRLDVDIRTRGKTRAERRICEFPPLRLDFDRGGDGTVFEGQNALKLVAHCQDGRPEYDQRRYAGRTADLFALVELNLGPKPLRALQRRRKKKP